MDTTQSDFKPESRGAEKVAGERRAYPRLNRWGTAWIGIFPEGTGVMGYLLDLGQGGCRIEADAAIPARDNARVEVLLHLEGLTLQLAGTIRRLEENNTRAGIKFTHVSPRKAKQIQKLIDQLFAEAD